MSGQRIWRRVEAPWSSQGHALQANVGPEVVTAWQDGHAWLVHRGPATSHDVAPTAQARFDDWTSARRAALGQGSALANPSGPEPPGARAFEVAVGAYSEVGHVRARNEDAFLVDLEHGLFLVADGMGGAPGGAEASQACVDVVRRVVAYRTPVLLTQEPHRLGDAVAQVLDAAVASANAFVRQLGRAEASLAGLGTTLVGLWLVDQAYVFFVGDSRCYRISSGQIEQLSRDHTWLAEQIRTEQITREQAAQMEDHAHILGRAIGTDERVELELRATPFAVGDVFLLCSDGLTAHVSDAEIAAAAKALRSPSLLARSLINMALSRGGSDNVTVVVVEITAPQPAMPRQRRWLTRWLGRQGVS